MSVDLRIIGDIHGHKETYLRLARGANASIQVGDLLGKDEYHYEWLDNSDLDPKCHGFFGGNHDNYDLIWTARHNLGDYGTFNVANVGKVFFVRGAFSIDYKHRCSFPSKFGDRLYEQDYWPEHEELDMKTFCKVMDLYEKEKPDILVSHECPLFIVGHVTNPEVVLNFGYSNPIIRTRTNQFLESLHEIHKPKYHVFGHYHRDWHALIDGTTFVCNSIGGYCDFQNGQLIGMELGDVWN